MYVPIVLVGFVGLLVGGHFFLSWLLDETREDREAGHEQHRPPRSFYNPRTWAAFRRLVSKRPLLLMYRRDKKGRFRKLSPGIPAKPARRTVKRRPRSRRSESPLRQRTHIPAE